MRVAGVLRAHKGSNAYALLLFWNFPHTRTPSLCGFETVMPTNKTPKPPADEEATAYHEAGHAVVGAIRGRAPLFVTIIRSGRFAGRTEFPQDWQQKFMTYFDDSPEKHEFAFMMQAMHMMNTAPANSSLTMPVGRVGRIVNVMNI